METEAFTALEIRDKFIAWEAGSRDSIEVKRCYVDLAGDLVSGLLLSQIIYWFLPTSRGAKKTSVELDGTAWLAKGREDWWEECRISPKQFDRAITILRERGLATTRVAKFHGVTVIHISVCWETVNQGVNRELTKGQIGNSPSVKSGIDQRSNHTASPLIQTETTSETTPETLPRRLDEEAKSVLCYLKATTGRPFRECPPTMRLIQARLRESDVTVPEVKKMIDRQARKWLGTEYEEYLRPATLFGPHKFTQYYDARSAPIIRPTQLGQYRPVEGAAGGTPNNGF